MPTDRQGQARKPTTPQGAGAIVTAAGKGDRFGGDPDFPKQFRPLAGIPVLCHSVRLFLAHPRISRVAVVLPGRLLEAASILLKGSGLKGEGLVLVAGGAARGESVALGLGALGDGPAYIVVHDGVRPLATARDVDRVLDAAEAHGASLLARRLPDTLKREGPGGDGFVAGTLPRNGLWLAQTPQAFRRDILEEALRAGDPKAATDEASLAEALGARVALVPGDAWNVKITDPADLAMAEALLLARGAPGWPCQAQPQAPPQGPPQAPPLPSPRGNPRGLGGPAKGSGLSVGQGWDFHRFAPGRELWLGCVRFEGCPGLEGHSDADVLTHALIDAILGAASLGDIGSHFPAGSEAFRGAPGRELLGLAWAKARDAFRIEHLDLTLFGESPRVAPRREEIRAAIASILGIPETKVNVKGKTTEGMGFLGRGEGLAASAAALLSRIPESGQG